MKLTKLGSGTPQQALERCRDLGLLNDPLGGHMRVAVESEPGSTMREVYEALLFEVWAMCEYVGLSDELTERLVGYIESYFPGSHDCSVRMADGDPYIWFHLDYMEHLDGD